MGGGLEGGGLYFLSSIFRTVFPAQENSCLPYYLSHPLVGTNTEILEFSAFTFLQRLRITVLED